MNDFPNKCFFKQNFFHKILIFFSFLLLSCIFATKDNAPYAPPINIHRLSGIWFELARKPSYFQEDDCSTCFQYKVFLDKYSIPNLAITNTSIFPGKYKQISSNGKIYDQGYNRRILVSFSYVEKLKNLISQYNYIIYYINEDYSEVVIGSPNHKYLWILSKDPFLSKKRLQSLITIAKNYQFDTSNLIQDNWSLENYKKTLKIINNQ